MDITVTCANEGCVAFGKEKPVPLANMLGYGAFSSGVRCPACGTVMTTTKKETAGQRRAKMLRSKGSSKPKPKKQ
jgi:hypothetical protein